MLNFVDQKMKLSCFMVHKRGLISFIVLIIRTNKQQKSWFDSEIDVKYEGEN